MKTLARFALAAAITLAVGAFTTVPADAAKFIEAPREVTIVKPVMPTIPPNIVVAKDMRVRFLINKKGKVENVFVEQSSGYAPVDEAVKAAIKQWEFTPAIGVDQKAHASIIGMTITLPKENAPVKSGNGTLTMNKTQTAQADNGQEPKVETKTK